MSTRLVAYVDGSAIYNPGGPGGWGVLYAGRTEIRVLCGGSVSTTNNRMELMAAIQALGNLPRPCAVRILSDSQYLIKGITQWWPKWEKKGWRRKHGPIPNTDLWKQLIAETARHDVEWQWVKGHAGNLGNECADVLATAGRLRAMGETVEVTAQMFYDRHGPDLAHRLAGSP